MPGSPEEWFKNLTPISKTWLAVAVITTVGSQFGFINLAYLYFDPQLIYGKFHLWRLFTTFFYFGKLGFGFLIQMFILTKYTQMLETEHFPGPSGLAEMVFLLLFGGSGLILLNWIFFSGKIPFLASALSFVLLYVWSRKSPMIDVSFWGFQFKAWHLPFVLLVFTFIMGNSPVLDIFGILVGHLYHFLMDIVPRVYNKRLISCPQFLYKIFDRTEARRDDWRGAVSSTFSEIFCFITIMGDVCCCCFQNEAEEYAKLTAHVPPKYNTDNAAEPKIKLSISRSLTKDKLFLVQIGILGDIEIYEKRCWLLRLLDGDQFETEKQTKKEELRNNQISQCNKKFKMNGENYCSQLQLINDMVFLDDNDEDSIIIGNHDFDINKYNALLLCYDITSLHSFNKLREYLDTIRKLERCDTLQVGIMGIFPSCDVVGNEGSENQRKVGENEARQLCTEYNSINIEFVGETNAKTGQNVGELVQNMIQKCVDTQSMIE